MSQHTNYVDLIERYLAQSLPEKERILFEQALASDPALHKEFLLQKDIIEGIQNHRRAELKDRLDQITPPPFWNPFLQYGALKTGIAITGILIIGAAAFWFGTGAKEPGSSRDLAVSTADALRVAELPAIAPETSTTETEAADLAVAEEPVAEVVEETPAVASAKRDATPDNKESESEKAVAEAAPPREITKPNVIANFDEEVVGAEDPDTDAELPELGASEVVSDIDALEVATKESKRYAFHYQFFNNKLYLYGDFEQIPYEILELNHLSGKTHYLYYKDTYYPIAQNVQDISPLVPIDDEDIIRELTIIRKNKSLHKN